MRSPDKAVAILKAMVEAVDIPVTVKIRSGWDEQTSTRLMWLNGRNRSASEPLQFMPGPGNSFTGVMLIGHYSCS